MHELVQQWGSVLSIVTVPHHCGIGHSAFTCCGKLFALGESLADEWCLDSIRIIQAVVGKITMTRRLVANWC